MTILSAALGAMMATSACAQHSEPHLDVPLLVLTQLEPPRASPLPAISPAALADNHALPTVTAGSSLSTVFVSLGAGLALAGGFHVLRAHDRAQECHRDEDRPEREAEQRRAGWTVALLGTGTVLTTLTVWTVQRLRGVAPPFTRPMRWIAATSPLVVGTFTAALLWAGMTVRSVGCYNS